MNVDFNEGLGGIGSICVAWTYNIEASSNVFINGKAAATISVGSPFVFYLGWILIISCFLFKTFNTNLYSLLKDLDKLSKKWIIDKNL